MGEKRRGPEFYPHHKRGFFGVLEKVGGVRPGSGLHPGRVQVYNMSGMDSKGGDMRTIHAETFREALDVVESLRGEGGTVQIRRVEAYTIPAAAPWYAAGKRDIQIRPHALDVSPTVGEIQPEGFLIIDDSGEPWRSVYVRWSDLDTLRDTLDAEAPTPDTLDG